MKILFINPPYTNLSGINESAGHMMPLCFGYLASYAEKHIDGLTFKIFDAEAEGASFKHIRKVIVEFKADLIALTSPTPAINHVYRIVRIAKEVDKGIYTVLGGIHPTVMIERTMEECKLVDFIIAGEGEQTFSELVHHIKNGKKDFHSIDGLCFRTTNKIHINPKRKLIQNLDEIPFPNRDLYNLKLYRSAPTKKVSNENATPILTSRGCPHNCIHCPSRTIWGRTIRYRSTESVVEEIRQCVEKYNIREFNLFDDTFTINKRRVMAFCQEIIQHHIEIYWICFARTDVMDDEMVKMMKRAGCRKISFGFESGDQKILNTMRKNTTLEKCRQTVSIVRNAEIPVHGSFMIGNIGETEDSIKNTIEFAKSLDLDNATFFITVPFPGTDLYLHARNLGFITDATTWESFAPLTNAEPILVQKNLSKNRLIYWQKKAFREFYLRPVYILKLARKYIALGGIASLFEGLRIFLRILAKRTNT